MCSHLWEVGIEEIYLDGSFTEAKAYPNDIDGYFECDVRRVATGELQREPWSDRPKEVLDLGPKGEARLPRIRKEAATYVELPMWHAYRVELYPYYDQPAGITDEYGNPLTFPAAFRKRRRDDEPRGIVKAAED